MKTLYAFKSTSTASIEARTPQLELIPQETPPPQKAPPAQEADESAGSRKRKPKKPKLKMQIAELAAQGVPAQKIASRLKLSIAEVDLALNLLHRNSHE